MKESEESDRADECIRLRHLGALLQADENRVLGELRRVIRLSFGTTKGPEMQVNTPPVLSRDPTGLATLILYVAENGLLSLVNIES